MKNFKILLIIINLSLIAHTQNKINKKSELLNSSPKISNDLTQLIYNYTKLFPQGTQLSIALIKNKNLDFIGVKRTKDTIIRIQNHKNVFEIGSLTKVFTATLLSNLAINKTIDLDDNIQDYINFKINVEDKISFKSLANHTSGLPVLPSNFDFTDYNNPYIHYSKDLLFAFLKSKVVLNKESINKHEYSNLGSGLLGFLMADLSKMSYEDLVKKEIFNKYNMANTTTKKAFLKNKIVKGLDSNGIVTNNWDFDVLVGCGGVLSTAEDLSKFALAQFECKNAELSLTHKPTFSISETMSIGLGWFILKTKDQSELIWHNGGTNGYRSSMALDVENQNGVIILSNVSAYHEKEDDIDLLCFKLMNELRSEN
ncbi:MAG: hypothetical protein Wins2KO_29080 [Winogradskyella sp.]